MHLHRLLAAASLSSLLTASLAQAATDYPPTRIEIVEETFHGESIPDPYRWLEPLEKESAEVEAWTTAQNDFTRDVLEGLACREQLERAMRPLLEIGAVGMPRERQARLFWTQRDGDQDQPVLRVRDRDGAERVLLDPKALDPSGLTSMDWYSPSPDGTIVAVGLSRAGDEMPVLHLMHVADGTFLADEIAGKVTSPSWFPDGRRFVYGQLADPSDAYSRQYRVHEIGRSVRHDPVILRQREPSRVPYAAISQDGRWFVMGESRGWQASDLSVADAVAWETTGEIAPIAIAQGLDGRFSPVGIVGDTMFVQTTFEAPNGRLLAIDLNRPTLDAAREIVAQREEAVLDGVSLARGVLVATWSEVAVSSIERYDLSGSRLGAVELPGLGSASVGTDPDLASGFVSFTSYNRPRTIYRCDFAKGGSLEEWASPPVPVDPNEVVVSRLWATSKDGTRVPMFLVHKKGVVPDGTNPCLLYAYGGFNITMDPAFIATNWPWYEAGGVYAVAGLRGGGEFGKSWHRAGMLESKQNVFDDLFACAETLVSSGWSAPDRLLVRGGSNGGLLVGAAITQRPELWAGAISGVPLLDMLRYHRFLMARFWVPEYGSSEDAAQFEWLKSYSPYHRIGQGVKYPATLVTAGENDSRVHPLHARKMVARLQAEAANDPAEAPILLWVDRDAGHGGGKPLSLRLRDTVDQWSFLFWRAGLCR
jgi:prolyl oligopeptidase